jgi:transcriptional regulator with XRE-family HTH domain
MIICPDRVMRRVITEHYSDTVENGTQEAGDDAAFRRAVGLRIRVWRVVHDRSQDDLARAAGVTRNFVSAIERGAQGLDAVRLRRLAVAMGIELAELLADPDPAPRRSSDPDSASRRSSDPDPAPRRVPEPSPA